MEYSAGLYIEQEYRITWLRNIEYSEDSYSITCTAASKICVCVMKNLGNCAESLNSRQNCAGNLFLAQTELYSLGWSVTSMSELEFCQYIRINFL